MWTLSAALVALLPIAPTAPTATETPIPSDLSRQIAAHYDIGRDAFDFGGVSEVRTFALGIASGVTGKAYVTAALEALFPLIDDARPSDLQAACEVESPALCAAWYADAAHFGSTRLLAALAAMTRVGTGEDDDAVVYRAGVAAMRDYLGLTENEYVEVHATAGEDGGDAYTLVLIDEPRGLAHLVRYSW